MTRTPQLILSLSPDDKLVVELPGPFATRRRLDLHDDAESAFAQLKRILRAQVEDKTEIGTDGAPTEHQLRHWEKHCDGSPDARCRFCWEEGLLRPSGGERRSRRSLVYRTSEGVEVRRLKAKQSGLSGSTKSSKNATDMGL